VPQLSGIKTATQFPPDCLQVAVVGDVHGQWNEQDESALLALGVDLVLFVGDFGNEVIELVETIARMSIPMAVVFGNHDAWYTATPWGRQKCPYDQCNEDRVQEQMGALGHAHVGYGKRDFEQLGLSVVGGRPFSWGGPEWKYEDFYAERFGVCSMHESCDRIVQAAQRTQFETLIFLSHNGPTGLGDHPEAPCGKDWIPIGGDHGDPDLEKAMTRTKALGKKIPLVVFGHMHHELRHRKDRLRDKVYLSPDGTVYLNAACVPRIHQRKSVYYRNFSMVRFWHHQVMQVRSVWVSPEGEIDHDLLLFESDTQPSEILSVSER
jgi:uncharacterized protein (TIGR04168 family)